MNCPYCQQPFIDASYLIKKINIIYGSSSINDLQDYQLLQCDNHQSVVFRKSINLDTNLEVYRLFMVFHKQMWYGIMIVGKSDAFEIRKYSQDINDPNIFTQHEFVAGFPTSASAITANNVLSKLQTILTFL